jgi:hypothetical protein
VAYHQCRRASGQGPEAVGVEVDQVRLEALLQSQQPGTGVVNISP